MVARGEHRLSIEQCGGRGFGIVRSGKLTKYYVIQDIANECMLVARDGGRYINIRPSHVCSIRAYSRQSAFDVHDGGIF